MGSTRTGQAAGPLLQPMCVLPSHCPEGQTQQDRTDVLLTPQVGAIPANAVDDGQWSQGLISAVSIAGSERSPVVGRDPWLWPHPVGWTGVSAQA